MSLVLTRKVDEGVIIHDNILITVRRISKHSVRLSFEADPSVTIRRSELVPIDQDADTQIECEV